MTITIIALAVFALAVFSAIAVFNSLVTLRNRAQNAWRQIDVQLRRRHDLIPNLVETVRGTMKFEQETLTGVIEARNRAVAARDVRDKAVEEDQLTRALGRLFALAENYPQLRSNANAMQLQEELVSTENRIAFARQLYNDLATRYNITTEVFPSNLIARMASFGRLELFEVPEEERTQVPQVNLGLKR
ncbi:MAG: LemA family protein [Deltaproteobacteria bacterium]